MLFQTEEGDFQLLNRKKGESTLITRRASKKSVELEHDRKKRRLVPEGEPLPFLIELGLMNAQGKAFPQNMDKFRQINHFLTMVDDSLKSFAKGARLQVVDFGCGKAYLT